MMAEEEMTVGVDTEESLGKSELGIAPSTEDTPKSEPKAEPESIDLDEPKPEGESDGGREATDYAKIVMADIESLKEDFADLDESFSLSDLKDPLRYGALRDLGLTAKEAYLASGGKKRAYDNRAHLTVSVPKSAVSRIGDIPISELKVARDIFSDMTDGELQRLYRKVNG